MIDTSVWLECRIDEELRALVESIANKHEVRSSEVIANELDKATAFLYRRRTEDYELSKSLHNKYRKAIVKSTNSVKNLANEYTAEAKKLRVPTKEKLADFTIVASATLDNVNFILTLNRKTMASEIMKTVYALVNSKKNLKTPQFLISKESIRRFSYA